MNVEVNYANYYAEHSTIKQLKELWLMFFPEDTKEYVDFFFENRFDAKNTVIAYTDNRVVGVIYLLPARIAQKPAYYMYAGGVHTDYRGKKIFYRLMDFIKAKAQAEGAELLCVAYGKLIQFYETYGFVNTYRASVIKKEADNSQESLKSHQITSNSIEASEYYVHRDSYFSKTDFLSWDKEALEYAVKELIYCGGFCHCLEIDNHKFYLLAEISDDELIVKEHTLELEDIDRFSDVICRYYGVKRAVFNVPYNAGETQITAIGTFDSEKLWVAFTLV